MIFKKIRSLVGRLFNENQQMLIVMFLSDVFWGLRKYFLSVVIEYPEEFLKNEEEEDFEIPAFLRKQKY